MQFKLNAISLALVLAMLNFSMMAAQDISSLKTIAELSDFKSTSTSNQVAEFIEKCAESASHLTKFQFGETVEKRPMLGITVSSKPYRIGQHDERSIALIIGNIHSGECAGKEAILMMIRELALKPDHPWLKNMVLIFVPNYNADANDRMGKRNRPGQIGPENGMGRRENAQNLDLNRDFVKLESPEARSLVKLIDSVDPHLFIDCHTTNGSQHQYSLTYDIPHNPATASQIRDYLRNKMMPEVTERLEQKGTKTFYYGNFNREHTSWTTFGHQPRYSTEYVGMRGRLAILSEAYSYISYKDRIFATKDFVSECLNYTSKNSDSIGKLLDRLDKDLIRVASDQPSRIAVSLNAKAEKFDKKFVLKGYKDDKPFDYECDFVGKYVSTRSVPLPLAYLIPSKHTRIVERLLMHGIDVEETTQDEETVVTVQTIKELNRNERVFQKHRMMQAQTQRESTQRKIAKGTYVVRTAQPLGRLVSYLLEAESDDGFVFWNFLDDDLKIDQEYPIQRIDQVMTLNTKRVANVKKSGRLTLDMLNGPNSILSMQPVPKWVGGDKIQIEMRGRKYLLNAKNMSFAQALDPVLSKNKLSELFSQTGIKKDDLDVILEVTPLESRNRNWLVFDTANLDLVVNAATETATLIGNDAELFTFSPDQNKLAYVTSKGLNVLNLEDMQTMTVYPKNPDNVLLGKLDWVYQEELYGRGNFKGYWFSPDSSTIAFLRLDESGVNKFTITDHIPTRGEDEFLSYPKAGDPNPVVSVGMADSTSSGDVAWVDLSTYSEEQPLVSNVSWRPDSSQLVLQIQNREQTYLDFAVVNRMGKEAKVLFRDKTSAWIESPGDPLWLKDGSFLWLSPRDGYKHLYHYNAGGSLRKQLTKGGWEIRRLNGFDQENEIAYFSSSRPKPYDLNVFKVDVKSGKLDQITTGAGTHSVTFNDEHSMFIDAHSTALTPTQYSLHQSDGTLVRAINISSDDRLQYVGLVAPEFMELQSGNDQPLDAMIIRPPNFDPNKKYPVLVHSYAGPQAPQVRNRFGRSWDLWHQVLAQQGYIIWKCDNQSASYRSAKYAWPIHRDLGKNELADIERGVDWLKRQPWVDPDRIGIWGWSYGGYITAYALTHSTSFKIGISGAPVTDWRNYDSIYTERLMGLPQDNPSGYDNSSVVKAAGNLSGKLLLIHGSIDDNVHLSNSMQFVLALQKAGKQFELMIYPKNRHAVRAPAQADHLRRLMFDFVLENL